MRPTRRRLTIRGLMMIVLVASLALGIFVAVRARRDRLIRIEHARAEHQHAIADRALLEALLGQFREQEATQLAQIQQAESALNDAVQRLDRLKRQGERLNGAGEVTASAMEAVEDAQSHLDQLRAWRTSFARRQETLTDQVERLRANENEQAKLVRELTGTNP